MECDIHKAKVRAGLRNTELNVQIQMIDDGSMNATTRLSTRSHSRRDGRRSSPQESHKGRTQLAGAARMGGIRLPDRRIAVDDTGSPGRAIAFKGFHAASHERA